MAGSFRDETNEIIENRCVQPAALQVPFQPAVAGRSAKACRNLAASWVWTTAHSVVMGRVRPAVWSADGYRP